MNLTRLIGVILIAGGIAGLAVGNFSFTRETHEMKLGPLEFAVKEKQDVVVPAWAAVAALVVGAGLLVAGGRRG